MPSQTPLPFYCMSIILWVTLESKKPTKVYYSRDINYQMENIQPELRYGIKIKHSIRGPRIPKTIIMPKELYDSLQVGSHGGKQYLKESHSRLQVWAGEEVCNVQSKVIGILHQSTSMNRSFIFLTFSPIYPQQFLTKLPSLSMNLKLTSLFNWTDFGWCWEAPETRILLAPSKLLFHSSSYFAQATHTSTFSAWNLDWA